MSGIHKTIIPPPKENRSTMCRLCTFLGAYVHIMAWLYLGCLIKLRCQSDTAYAAGQAGPSGMIVMSTLYEYPPVGSKPAVIARRMERQKGKMLM